MDNLNNLLQQAKAHQTAFVLYRLPEATQAQLLTGKLCTEEEFESGFVFAPFHGTPLYLNQSSNQPTAVDIEPTAFAPVLNASISSNSSQEAFEELVRKAQAVMRNGQAEKIVGSRAEEWTLHAYDPIAWFMRLAQAYPQAMVYCWFAPESGMWIGATPERLFALNQGQLQTMALAGTQLNSGQEPVIWGEKEQEEQAMVTRYIVHALQPYCENVEVGEVHTAEAAQLLHLRTLIHANLHGEKSWKDGVEALHPTPAVCGTPKAFAREFLLNHEGYDRAYYAGYLGPIASASQADLYVNLRCMQVFEDKLRFYVGCGLTLQSDPQLEWEETANKSQTLKRILQ